MATTTVQEAVRRSGLSKGASTVYATSSLYEARTVRKGQKRRRPLLTVLHLLGQLQADTQQLSIQISQRFIQVLLDGHVRLRSDEVIKGRSIVIISVTIRVRDAARHVRLGEVSLARGALPSMAEVRLVVSRVLQLLGGGSSGRRGLFAFR